MRIVVDIPGKLLLNQGMANARTNTIDLNTAEGCAAWAKTLPTANLREIASRPIVRGNVHMVFAADLELFVRGEA